MSVSWDDAWELAMAYKKRCARDLLRERVLGPFGAMCASVRKAISHARTRLPSWRVTNAFDRPILVAEPPTARVALIGQHGVMADFFGDIERYPDVYEAPDANVRTRVLPEVQRFWWEDVDYDEMWGRPQREFITHEISLRALPGVWETLDTEPDWCDASYCYKKAAFYMDFAGAERYIANPTVFFDPQLGDAHVDYVKGTEFIYDLSVIYQGNTQPIRVFVFPNPEVSLTVEATGETKRTVGGTVIALWHNMSADLIGQLEVVFAGTIFKLDFDARQFHYWWLHKDMTSYRGWLYLGYTTE